MHSYWIPQQINKKPIVFKTQIQAQNMDYRKQPLLDLHQNESYLYLGIQLVPSLKWKLQTHITKRLKTNVKKSQIAEQ